MVGFDSERFIKYCDKASPYYDPKIADFNDISRELFQTEEVWVSRDLIIKAMEALAKYHGFTICIEKETIMCNRNGKNMTSRAYVNGALKTGCTFQFKLASLETEKYLPPNSALMKWRYKNRWDRPTKIISGCSKHGEQCTPNRSNRITTCQRQGKYVNHIPSSAIFSLCNFLENSGRLDSNLVVNSLCNVWPHSKTISKHDVFNIHAKVMKLLPVYKQSNGDYEQFKAVVNASDMLNGIEDEVSLDDDEAYEFAQSLWLEVVSTTDSKEGLFSFIEYLDLISSKAQGFTYKIAESPSHNSTCGHSKKLLGVIWQTTTTRR